MPKFKKSKGGFSKKFTSFLKGKFVVLYFNLNAIAII